MLCTIGEKRSRRVSFTSPGAVRDARYGRLSFDYSVLIGNIVVSDRIVYLLEL